MDYKYILVKREDGIVTVTFNRPERLNGVNDQLSIELLSTIEALDMDDEVRVMILTGAGRAFCAGGDFRADDTRLRLPEMVPAQFERAYRRRMYRVMGGIRNLNIPTIAMVNGLAFGGGFDYALACDLRVGSENARFCVGWLRRAIIPAGGTTWTLPAVVGVSRAVEIILTARWVYAEEAERIGILNKLVPAQDLEKATMELARTLAKGPAVALGLAKTNIYAGLRTDMRTAYQMLGACQAVAFTTQDHKESVAAFREKREAVFKGK